MLTLSADTCLDLAVSGLRQGLGLVETLRVEGGRIPLLGLHLERLALGARALGLDEPPGAAAVLDFALRETLCAAFPVSVLRLMAVDGRLLVRAEPWNDDPEPVDLLLSHQVCRYSRNPLLAHKTLSRLENLLLQREAEAMGAFEAVALNEHGRLTEGSRCNLFLVRRGLVLTPPVWEGLLPGVARRVLLEGRVAVEHALGLQDLESAEAAFCTNALRGILPVRSVLGMGPKDPDHPVIRSAQAAYAGLRHR